MGISQIVFIVLAIILSSLIIVNTVKKKMFEKESLLWLFSMIIVLILGIFPNIIIIVAGWMGIDYAPSLLFLLSILWLIYLDFRLTTRSTALDVRVKELAQRNALLQERISVLEKALEQNKK